MEPCNHYRYLEEAKLYQDGYIICATMEVAADNWLSFFASTENTSEPRSELYLKLLPQEKQLKVVRLALERAASACRSFKRVPLPGTEWEQQDGKVIAWELNGPVMRPRGDKMAMDYSKSMKLDGQAIDYTVCLNLYYRAGDGSSSSDSDDEE
jgi:hypothetical protein